MILLAAYLGPNVWNLIAVIGLVTWTRPARVIRAQVLSLTGQEYVMAARSLGAGHLRIIATHIFPGIVPQWGLGLVGASSRPDDHGLGAGLRTGRPCPASIDRADMNAGRVPATSGSLSPQLDTTSRSGAV